MSEKKAEPPKENSDYDFYNTKSETYCEVETLKKTCGCCGFQLRVRYLQILMMFFCVAVMYVVRSSMGVAVLAMTTPHLNDTVIEVYEWSEKVRGMVLSSFYWGYTVLQVPAGVLAKRYGGQPLLLGGLVVNGLLCLAVPTLAKYGGWIAVCVVRAAMGLAQACLLPCIHTLLGKWLPPDERTRLSSVAYGGVPIGTILSMPLCGVLANTALGWKMIFYCTGVLALVTAVLWGTLAASSPARHRLIRYHERVYIEKSLEAGQDASNMPIPWRRMFRSRPLYAIACAHIGFNWGLIMLLVETPTYMKTVFNIDLTNSSTLSALPFAAQWLFTIAFGFVCEHVYNRNILTLTASRKLFNSIGAVGMAIGLVALSFLDRQQWVVAVALLTAIGGLLAASTGGYLLNHIDLSPTFGGVMYSLTNCAANLVGTGVPIFTSYVVGDDTSDVSGWRVVFCTSAVMMLLSNVVYVTLGTCEQQSWNRPPTTYGAYRFDVLDKSVSKEEKPYEIETKTTSVS